MYEVMIDIETLGTSPGSVILQIGACTFTQHELGPHRWCHSLPLGPQLAAGATIDAGTLTWWSSPDRLDGYRTLLEHCAAADPVVGHTLGRLSDWLREVGGSQVLVWANSPAFDLVLLEDLCRRFDVIPPWSYRNFRDYRTALRIYGYESERDVLPPPEGRHHALTDAVYQAQVLTTARLEREAP